MIRAALAGERLPALVVDLDAFDRNLDRVLDLVRPSRLPLRVATKSVRIPALLRRLQERGGDAMRGLMAYSIEEAELLVREGFDDIFVAYPPSLRKDADRAAGLADKASVAVDAEPHLRALSAAALARGVRIRVVLCVDMSLRLLGDRLHLGVRRSPLATERDVLALARVASSLHGIELVGLMGF